MSLDLSRGTVPNGLTTKVHPSVSPVTPLPVKYGSGGVVEVGDYILTMEDMLELAYYALTNTNIEGENDPRLQFVKSVAAMEQVNGYQTWHRGKHVNPHERRFDSNVPMRIED